MRQKQNGHSMDFAENKPSGTIEFHTQRLVLRQHRISDAETLYQVFHDEPDMTAYTGWNPYTEKEQAAAAVQGFIDSYEDLHAYSWAIEADGRFAGTIGAYDYNAQNDSIEIGYSIFPAFQGKGYATEALKAVLAYLLDHEQIKTVTAWCAAEHDASRHVLENAGMVCIGTENGFPGKRLVYEIRRTA